MSSLNRSGVALLVFTKRIIKYVKFLPINFKPITLLPTPLITKKRHLSIKKKRNIHQKITKRRGIVIGSLIRWRAGNRGSSKLKACLNITTGCGSSSFALRVTAGLKKIEGLKRLNERV